MTKKTRASHPRNAGKNYDYIAHRKKYLPRAIKQAEIKLVQLQAEALELGVSI